MKKFLRALSILSAFCVIFPVAPSVLGQTRAGAYKDVPVSDAAVKAAANFAVETKAAQTEWLLQLEEVLKAERQTAAGTNYRLCLLVTSQNEDEEEITLYIKTVVHRSPKGVMKITSWVEEDCGGD
jgi:hypothetical protein